MVDYRELVMKIPPQELSVIKTAAMGGSLSNGISLCAVYLPSMNPSEAKGFLDFLKQHG